MRKLILVFAGLALSFSMYAQQAQEGIKMYQYGRYESAKKALQGQSGDEAAYYLGLSELSAGNVQGAKDIFSKNTSFYGQSGLARVLLNQGNGADAMKTLQSIVDDAKKKDWEKYKVAADAITYSNDKNEADINKAIEWYTKANTISPQAGTYIALGDADLKLKTGGGDAINNFTQALSLTQDQSLAYSRLGSVYYAAHNYDKALENYDKAKNADPNNPLPYRDLAYAYYRIGKFELAKQNAEKYLSLSDKSIDDQILYANLLFLSKDYPNAIEKMNDLVKGGQDKAYMYRVLGFSQYETKDYQNALKNMRTFFSKPKDETGIVPDDYIYTGKIFTALAATDSAQAKVYNDSADYYFDKGIATDTSADKTKTLRDIEEAFKEAKNYPLTTKWYGKLIQASSDTSAEYKSDYFWWGVYAYYAKDYSNAKKIFSDMATKYPEETSPVYWMGRVTAASDDPEAKTGAAIEYYKKWLSMPSPAGVTKSNNDLMQAYQYLAVYYYNAKDKTNALDACNKILQLEPANKTAQQIIDVMSK